MYVVWRRTWGISFMRPLHYAVEKPQSFSTHVQHGFPAFLSVPYTCSPGLSPNGRVLGISHTLQSFLDMFHPTVTLWRSLCVSQPSSKIVPPPTTTAQKILSAHSSSYHAFSLPWVLLVSSQTLASHDALDFLACFLSPITRSVPVSRDLFLFPSSILESMAGGINRVKTYAFFQICESFLFFPC